MAVALIALGFSIGVFGPRLMARAFRHGLVIAIQQSLAGAETIDVSMAPVRPSDLIQGIFRDVRIDGAGFITKEGLRYDELHFSGRLIRIDPSQLFWQHQLVWREMKQTRLQVRLGETSLTEWLDQQLPELKPHVKLSPGILRIEGMLDLHWTAVDFGADGVLQRKTADSLIYIPQKLQVAGFTLPEKLFKRKLLASLGGWEIPLEMPFPMDLDSFRVEKGFLVAQWRETK